MNLPLGGSQQPLLAKSIKARFGCGKKNVLESIKRQNNFCINLRCGWFPAAATAESVEGDHVEKGDYDEGEVVEQA